MEQHRVSREDLLALARARVLTTADMAKVLGTTPPHAARLAFDLRRRGLLTQVMRGVYASVPLDVDPKGFRADPFLAVHKALGDDYVFSHLSALTLLGAEQTFHRTVHVSAPGVRPRKRGVGDFVVHVHSVREKGWEATLTHVRRGGESLRVTSPERTLVDLASLPPLAQDYEEALEAVRSLLRRTDTEKLLTCVQETDNRTALARLGHLLRACGADALPPTRVLEKIRSAVADASPVYMATWPKDPANRFDREFKVVFPGGR